MGQQRIRQLQRQAATPTAAPPAQKPFSWQRPFPAPAQDTATSAPQPIPNLQARLEILRRANPDWSKVKFSSAPAKAVQAKLTVGAPNDQYEQEADRVADQVMSMPDGATKQPIQREAAPEEDELQTKPLAASITPLVQRDMAPDEEEVQPKLATDVLQREAMPEEDEIQPKLLGSIQRAEMPEEEEVQTKSLANSIQREEMPEEEELQTKPLGNGMLQREAMPEEEEEPVQAKLSGSADIQREAMPEEDEELQTKPLANTSIQREALPEEEEPLQTKPSPTPYSSLPTPHSLESKLFNTQGSGSPLPNDVRSFMEPRFGADFSQVRVHTGSESVQMNRDLNAQAFTHKQDLYFGAGKSPGKDALTAHELTHVVQQTGDRVQRAPGQTWIGERTNWVRTATRADNWANADPPGAYYVLNSLSMDDMVRILRSLTSADRKKLSGNLDEYGAGFDRPRIQLALTNAETGSKDKWWQDLSEKVHRAIRSNKFVEYPDGAFWIINPLNENDSKRIMKFLNRDSLDELIANGKNAVEAGVPNAQRILRDANQARGSVKSTKNEQYLIDLIDGNDWKTFFTKFNELNETDKLRFLRNSFGAAAKISNNIDKASGISDQDYLRHLIETVTNDASTNLYVDAMVKTYNWQPKYRVNDPKEFSRIIRFGNTFDIEIDINSIDDGQMSDEEADKQFREAKLGPGGFLWPAVRNRSTLPILWQVKQDVHKQMESLLFDDVLAAGIETVMYLLTVVFPEARSGARQSLKELSRGSLSTRWMKGAYIIKGRMPPTVEQSVRPRATPGQLHEMIANNNEYYTWRTTNREVAGNQAIVFKGETNPSAPTGVYLAKGVKGLDYGKYSVTIKGTDHLIYPRSGRAEEFILRGEIKASEGVWYTAEDYAEAAKSLGKK